MCEESRRHQVTTLNENLRSVEHIFTMLLSFPSIMIFFFPWGYSWALSVTEKYSCFGDRAAIGKEVEYESQEAGLRCDVKHPPNPSSSIEQILTFPVLLHVSGDGLLVIIKLMEAAFWHMCHKGECSKLLIKFSPRSTRCRFLLILHWLKEVTWPHPTSKQLIKWSH